MDIYRIRKDGIEFPVAGVPALERMILDGVLLATQKIFDPASREWRPAGEVEALKPIFQRRKDLTIRRPGPASATDPVGQPPPSQARSLLDPPTGEVPRPPRAPQPGATPWEEPPARPSPAAREGEPPAADLFSVPDDLVEGDDPDTDLASPLPSAPAVPSPAEEDPVADLPEHAITVHDGDEAPSPAPRPDPSGQLIPFPADRRSQRTGLDPVLPPLPDIDRLFTEAQSQPRRSGTSAPSLRIGCVLFATLVAALGAWWMTYFVKHEANLQFNKASRIMDGEDVAPPKAEPEPDPMAAQVELYRPMEEELRGIMNPGVVDLVGPTDLESALMVELSRFKIPPRKVSAPLTGWSDAPGAARPTTSIEILYAGRPGELDRELGAIGLVVGKYMQHYSLDVVALNVAVADEGGAVRTRGFVPNQARLFYLQQIPMARFLLSDAH